MKKILIIKMGYSETLDIETNKVVSLGDVLRATVILEPLKEKYENAEITWLVSNDALPLIKGSEYIDKYLIWDEFVPYVLMRENYDMVINLEKINGICALTDMINAWEKVGFRFNTQTGEFDTYMNSMIAKQYIANKENTRSHWQEIFSSMLGLEWKKQEYSLGYKPTSEEIYDVGLNYKVGTKWPGKAMSIQKWEELETLLNSDGKKVSWQQGSKDLYEYIEWINSCKVLITNDSLGLHIALALKKYVIALFGPTDEKEVYMYDRGVSLVPKTDYDCLPCYSPICDKEILCMDLINVEDILSAMPSNYNEF